MELKAASCGTSIFFFLFTNLSHSLRQTFGCLPSQGGLQYRLRMGVNACTAVSVNFNQIKVSQPSLKECRDCIRSSRCCRASNAAFHHFQSLFQWKTIGKAFWASKLIYKGMILSVLEQSPVFHKPLIGPLLSCPIFSPLPPQWETITNDRPTIRAKSYNSLR